MARESKQPETNQQWSVSYRQSAVRTSDNLRSIELSWDNQGLAEVAANLNAFLVAVGVPLAVVSRTD